MIKGGTIKTSILVLFSIFASTYAIAQPTYQEDMARQQADWLRNQNAYHHQLEVQNAAAEEEYYREQEYSQPQIQYSKNYFAMATNINYDAIWASWNHSDENDAKDAVLKACKNATKSDCQIFQSARNSSITVARAPDGFFDSGWGRTPYEAQEAALKKCGSRFCTIYKTYDFPGKQIANSWVIPQRTNGIDDDFPQNPARHQFTIGVKPKNDAPFEISIKYWLGSGFKDFETGKRQLLDYCKSKTSYDCELTTVFSNVVTGFYINENTGSVRYVSGANSSIVENIMNDECRQKNANCHIFDTLDYRQVTIKEFNQTPRKVRGFLALSLSQQPNNQIRNLTISLGNNSLESAQTNAISECQVKSKNSCALIDKNMDDGTYVYIGLYYTQKRNVTWFFGSSEESIANYAAQNCKNCEMIAIVDARENGLRSFNLHN